LPVQLVYPAFAPKWKAVGGITSPQTAQVYPAENATFRDGDILLNVTTGAIVVPTGGTAASFTNATGANTPGPFLGPLATSQPSAFNVGSTAALVQGAVTVTGVASAGAPARTLFGVVTYTITAATESQNSQPFIINLQPGFTATINVAAAGAPAGATTYTVYLGFLPNTWARQFTVITLGTATGNILNPLTNSVGANRASAGSSTGIIGVADVDSDAYYGGQQGATAGGSQFTGKRGLFGATQSYGPGWTNDPFALPITKLQSGLLEMSLVQPFNNTLFNAAVGLNIDSTTGYFVADTSQTAVGVIRDLAFSPNQGNVNDVGARVLVAFNAAALI
jgi:hypothetical protein